MAKPVTAKGFLPILSESTPSIPIKISIATCPILCMAPFIEPKKSPETFIISFKKAGCITAGIARRIPIKRRLR